MMAAGTTPRTAQLLWLVLCLSVFGVQSTNQVTQGDFSKCLILTEQPRYQVCWMIVGPEVHLQFTINATGRWFGFGLGEPTSGSMPGSDVVTMMIQNGQPSAIDRNALGFFPPEEDKCQDWKILSASEQAGMTVFEIKRKLNTEDTQDRPFTVGPNKIVWSIGKSTSFSYHGPTRGVDAIDFFATGASTTNNNHNNNKATSRESVAESVSSFAFRMPNVTVPAKKTTYICQSFSFPVVEDAHIISVEPIIEEHSISKDFVHHFLVHICEPAVNGTNFWNKYQTPGECSSPLGDLNTGCVSLLYVWAVGSNSLILPPQAGFRMGTKQSYGIRHGILEIHYDNPTLVAGITDDSGIRVSYTEQLRANDAGVMTIGDILTTFTPIPSGLSPYAPGSYYQANCPIECTSDWSHDITVFADGLHMHQAGSSIWSTQWRGNEYLGLFNQISFYQFDFQQITFLNKVIKRGDRINLNCVYDTSDRTSPTKFAIGSEDEMCMEFIFYYPILFAGVMKPYAFCGFVQPPGSSNMTWCGNYDASTALKPGLTNPTVWDPESLGATTFGLAPSVCSSGGDGGNRGDGDDDGPGFWIGFLVGAAVVAVVCLGVAAVVGGVMYWKHRRTTYELFN